MANPEQMSLENILSDDKPADERETSAPPEKTEAPAPEKPSVERVQSRRKAHEDKEQAAQGRVRDPETGQFAKVDEKPAEPAKESAKPEVKAEAAAPAKPAAAPQQDFTEKEKAFLRAAQEERGKRQELERQLAAMNAAKVAPPQAAAPQEQPKTFWDDPEGGLAKHESKIERMLLQGRIQSAEFVARQKHPDYDQTIEAFGNLLKQTPGLYERWINSPDPAEFAYGASKNYTQLQEVGSIDGLRAKIEKETRIKLEAELREKADALAKERAAIPPSLSEARATGANKPVWGGVPSLDDVLKG